MASAALNPSFEGRVALITGSTGGIGRAAAELLLESGARVAVTALPLEHEIASRTALELDPSGDRVRAYPLDVRSGSVIQSVVNQVREDFGGLDVLVNNAGVRLVASSLSTTEDEWDELAEVNLKGLFFCCQAAAGHMRKAGGSIINISSQLGLVVAKDRAAYCATKAAVIHLTKALALDWAPYGIRVNAVAPGATHTPSTTIAHSREEAIDLLCRLPLGRPIEPEDVARAIAFLASSHSEAMTGQTLAVDGGWTLL